MSCWGRQPYDIDWPFVLVASGPLAAWFLTEFLHEVTEKSGGYAVTEKSGWYAAVVSLVSSAVGIVMLNHRMILHKEQVEQGLMTEADAEEGPRNWYLITLHFITCCLEAAFGTLWLRFLLVQDGDACCQQSALAYPTAELVIATAGQTWQGSIAVGSLGTAGVVVGRPVSISDQPPRGREMGGEPGAVVISTGVTPGQPPQFGNGSQAVVIATSLPVTVNAMPQQPKV